MTEVRHGLIEMVRSDWLCDLPSLLISLMTVIWGIQAQRGGEEEKEGKGKDSIPGFPGSSFRFLEMRWRILVKRHTISDRCPC